jgi:hypothetical protein
MVAVTLAVFPTIAHRVSSTDDAELCTPPPILAMFPDTTQSASVAVEFSEFAIPPPFPNSAMLSAMTQLVSDIDAC